jgi:hypothetical protein
MEVIQNGEFLRIRVMIEYITIGAIYILSIATWLYIVENNVRKGVDLLIIPFLVLIWPIILLVQIYTCIFHYEDNLFAKDKND